MDVAVPMVMLQHYLNPCLHYLIGPAMVTLIMWHLDDAVEVSKGRYWGPQKSISKDARWDRTLPTDIWKAQQPSHQCHI